MYARRLGVAGSSDRIRPLLVGLSSAEEASSLLSRDAPDSNLYYPAGTG